MKHIKLFEYYNTYNYSMELEDFENWYVGESGEGLADKIYDEVIMNENDEYGKELIKKALEDLFPNEPINDDLIEAALNNVKQIG